MKIRSAQFITSSPDYPGCPDLEPAEFAFIGRSNVGKSSLLNMLTNKQGLAKVSSKPGHTTLINFFNINDQWTMVDLPGYGYARRSAEQQEKFNEFVSDYIAQRPNLICVFLLIDCRIPPQQSDLQFLEWLVDHRIRFCLIFTKGDKVKPQQLKSNISDFLEAMHEFIQGVPPYFACSSKSGKGRGQILEFIEQSLRANKKAL